MLTPKTGGNYLFQDACLIIMAKAPVPGQVKTRLIPALGEENAANLYRSLVKETTEWNLKSRVCPVHLWCHPNSNHPDFLDLEQAGATLFQQQGTNLGNRMNHALVQSLQSFHATAVIGCDCPSLSPDIIHSAFAALTQQHFDAVLGPAEDGGYYLLAINRPAPSLFQDIAWGTSRVLNQTRAKLRALGWQWSELETLWDIDRPNDLARIPHEFRSEGPQGCGLTRRAKVLARKRTGSTLST